MDEFPITKVSNEILRDYFGHIPHPPKQLSLRGTFPVGNHVVFLTVVGSRNHSNYGADVVKNLISGLQGYPIVIVSGLAVGIDTLAHQTAIEAGLITLGFPGSGLDSKTLYPRSSILLAEKILHSGGGLVSEFDNNVAGNTWTFPARNRLMAALGKATLLIEATHKSGSRITAKLATEYNRDVLAVPGSIFSERSEGPNALIKLGAFPVISSHDILEALGFQVTEQPMLNLFSQANKEEQFILSLLASPMSRGNLIRASKLEVSTVNILISQMEIKGLIKESYGELRRS